MLIQADGLVFVRNQPAPLREAVHADETAARVEIDPPFGIIPMRDERNVQAIIAEEIEPIHGVNILPDLVDFIDGQRVGADRNCRRRGKDQRRAEAVPGADHIPG